MVVDPGMATGIATFDRDPTRVPADLFATAQIDSADEVLELVELRARTGLDELVVEDFNLGSVGRAKTTAGIRATIELIGALRWIAGRRGVPFVLQSPADAATFSTNEKLRRAGFSTPAKPDHQRSAARHLLLRLVRIGAIDGTSLIR